MERQNPLPVVVAIGDSITDGAHSIVGHNASWPSQLAVVMLRSPRGGAIVLNEGIGGNRLVHRANETDQPTAVVRFDRDALNRPGLASVILLDGINDIGTSTSGSTASDISSPVTADEMIFAMKQLIDRCHLRHIRIFGGTIPPYAGARYCSERGDVVRTSVNEWMRESGAFDGVIDFDRTLADPEHTSHLLPAFDCGDHLHPSEAGYAAMAKAAADVLIRSKATKYSLLQ